MIGQLLYTIIPVAGAAILHMVVVRMDAFAGLARPIDGGRGWFGDNKTWRGFVVMILAAMLVTCAQAFAESSAPSLADWNLVDYGSIHWAMAGFWWGFGYAASELPNSFLKRRAGIAPGSGKGGAVGVALALMDQADSAIGGSLVAWLALGVDGSAAMWMAILGTLVHFLFNLLLGAVGIRERMI